MPMSWRTGRKPFQVTAEAARRLPDYGHAYTFAMRIGASKSTVLNWIQHKGLPYIQQDDGTFVLERREFLEYCARTGRYNGPLL
jgi:hypothetical protein